MRNEKQNVDQKGEESDQQRGKGQDQKGQQVSRRMGRRVEMRCNGQTKTDEGEQSCYGVHDED